MKVTLDHKESITSNITTFWFSATSLPRYNAGQFIELRLPHDDKDKRGDKRWFTLSSSPTESMLSITTKLAAENGSSFKTALRHLGVGTELDMAAPMGDFILPKDPSVPLVFVAGGIGCTPFRSMVKYLQDSGQSRDITLLYAASDNSEVAFRNIFEKLGNKFQIIVGTRLDAAKIIELSGATDNHYLYLSGPEPMIEALAKDLKNNGINKKKIYTDFFPGYTQI